jgi:hypothetical protein
MILTLISLPFLPNELSVQPRKPGSSSASYNASPIDFNKINLIWIFPLFFAILFYSKKSFGDHSFGKEKMPLPKEVIDWIVLIASILMPLMFIILFLISA